MSEDATYAAIANDFEYNIKSFKRGDEYPYIKQIEEFIGKTVFTINIIDLNDRLAADVINEPDSALSSAKEAVLSILREYHPSYEQEVRDVLHVQIIGLDPIPMRSILSDSIDKLVSIEGKLVGISDTEPLLLKAAYRCQNCNAVNEGYTKGLTFLKPKKCSACSEKELELDNEESIYADVQVLRIQESSNESGKQLTCSCIVSARGQLWLAKAGETVRITGIFRVDQYREQKTGRMRSLKKIQVVSLERLQDNDVIVTPRDITRFKDMVADPLHYQILIESFAPHLHGLEEQKEICALVLASCGTRRPFNGAIFGPPAKGKTELIKYAVALHPNGHYSTIPRASIAGLTSSFDNDPDTNTRITKPGLFAIADGGIVGLTELQAIKQDLAQELNDALESKEIASAMAEGEVRLMARCAVLIDSNNFEGGWDYALRLLYNINEFLKPNTGAFVSRLDLTSIVEDVKEAEHHREIARKNFGTYRANESALDIKREDWQDDSGILHYGFNTLRKYFVYVCSLPLPELDPKLEKAFIENYESAMKNNKDYLVDGRYNRTVLLLSRIRARLLLKSMADLDDLQEAIRLVNRSKNVVVSTGDGKTDANELLGVPSKDKQEKKKNDHELFWDVWEKLKKATEVEGQMFYFVREGELNSKLEEAGWSEDKITRFIRGNQDRIYSPIPGHADWLVKIEKGK